MDDWQRSDGDYPLERLLAWAWLPVLMAFDCAIFVTQQMVVAHAVLHGGNEK